MFNRFNASSSAANGAETGLVVGRSANTWPARRAIKRAARAPFGLIGCALALCLLAGCTGLLSRPVPAGGALASAGTGPNGGTASAPPAVLPPLRQDAALAHHVALLQRLSFGVNGALLAQLDAAGSEARWLDQQLHPAGDEALPADVRQRLAEFHDQQAFEPRVIDLERRRKAARALPNEADRKPVLDALREESGRLGREAQLEVLWRETYSHQQLQELLTAFWTNHFNVFIGKGDVQVLASDYVDHAIRPHVFGRFQDLLRAAASHPAMLRYLDNDRNAAGKINENFARELLELHTLGVNGGYTQRDVQELARALTGFGVWTGGEPPRTPRNAPDAWRRDGLFEYTPGRHDFGDKVLLGERLHEKGWREFDEVMTRLSRNAATIHHVTTQYATYLLGQPPSAELLAQMGSSWLASDGDLRKLTLVVIASADFEASLQKGFKTPQRYVMSALRLAYEDKVVLNMQPALNWLNRMQQAPFGHPTPDGYPLLSEGWTAPGQFATRFEIARQLGFGSAGLFRTEGTKAEEQPAFPQLATSFYYRAIEPQLLMSTRQALAQARSPQEWSLLMLSSPDMMRF